MHSTTLWFVYSFARSRQSARLSVWMIAFFLLSAVPAGALTNEDVVKMVKAELSESTIVLAVKNASNSFDLSASGLIGLKEAGVGARIIESMLASKSGDSKSTGSATIDPPSEIEASQFLEKFAGDQSNGAVTLLSFSKINGQSGVESGVPVYQMDYELVVRVNENCIWREINLSNQLAFNVAIRSRNDTDNFLFVTSNPGIQVKSGEQFLVRGTIFYDHTERGWRVKHMAKNELARDHSSITKQGGSQLVASAANPNDQEVQISRTSIENDFAKSSYAEIERAFAPNGNPPASGQLYELTLNIAVLSRNSLTDKAQIDEGRLISGAQLAKNLQHFYNIEADVGVRLSDLRQLPPERASATNPYNVVSFQMRLEGGHTTIMNFIKRLKTSDSWFVRIQDFSLKKSGAIKG